MTVETAPYWITITPSQASLLAYALRTHNPRDLTQRAAAHNLATWLENNRTAGGLGLNEASLIAAEAACAHMQADRIRRQLPATAGLYGELRNRITKLLTV